MEIKDIPIGDINPAPYNPRIDLQPGDPDYDKLVKSLEEFDLVEPLIWNETTMNLVGGHQRLKILVARGDRVVTVSVVHLSEEKEKALNLALNKIGGGWDTVKLTELLQEVEVSLPDIEITGFDKHEINKLISKMPDFVEVTSDDQSNLDDKSDGYEGMATASAQCPKCGYLFTPGIQKKKKEVSIDEE